MELDMPEPNEALAAVLLSAEMHHAVEDRGHAAQLLFVAEVAKRTGRLAAAAHVVTEIGGVRHDRWVSHMTVGGIVGYAAAHQFGHWQDESHLIGSQTAHGESHVFVEGAHDLNRVLEQLAAL